MNDRAIDLMTEIARKSQNNDGRVVWQLFGDEIVRECLRIIEDSEGDLDFAVHSIKRAFDVE